MPGSDGNAVTIYNHLTGTVGEDGNIIWCTHEHAVSRRDGVGRYVLEFGMPFDKAPAVLANLSATTTNGVDESPVANLAVGTVTTTHATFNTGNHKGIDCDKPFSFHIFGPNPP